MPVAISQHYDGIGVTRPGNAVPGMPGQSRAGRQHGDHDVRACVSATREWRAGAMQDLPANGSVSIGDHVVSSMATLRSVTMCARESVPTPSQEINRCCWVVCEVDQSQPGLRPRVGRSSRLLGALPCASIRFSTPEAAGPAVARHTDAPIDVMRSMAPTHLVLGPQILQILHVSSARFARRIRGRLRIPSKSLQVSAL